MSEDLVLKYAITSLIFYVTFLSHASVAQMHGPNVEVLARKKSVGDSLQVGQFARYFSMRIALNVFLAIQTDIKNFVQLINQLLQLCVSGEGIKRTKGVGSVEISEM